MKLPKLFIYGNKNLSKHPADKRLAKVVQEEYKKIDALANEKKMEIDYIAGVVKKYWPRLVEILDPNNNFSSDQLDKVLFENVKKSVERLEDYCKPNLGFHVYNPEHVNILEKWLGWVGFKRHQNTIVYSHHLTKEGIEILDGLRKIKGQVTVKEIYGIK